MNRNKASLVDVARRASVSAMTVSRCLANPELVRGATREKIQRAIADLGYQKDLYASINSRKRGAAPATRTILFNCRFEQLADPGRFPFFSVVYFHFLRAIMERGWRTVLTDIEADPGSFANAGLVDAVVLCGDVGQKSLRQVGFQDAPLFSICAGPAAPFSIDPDDEQGGRLAAEFLLAQGHREHLALVYSPNHANHRGRQESFCKRVAEISPRTQVDLIKLDLTRDRARTDHLGQKVLSGYFKRRAVGAQAIFATNSYSSYLVWRFLSDKGIGVPGEMGFLGYDNPPFYEDTPVPLSRIWFDPAEVGVAAAAQVSHALENPGLKTRRTLIPVTLMDFGSAARPSP